MSFEQEEIDAAIASISDPARLAAAQDLLAAAAPNLQAVLVGALADGGWFDTAHDAAVRDAASTEELAARVTAIKVLFAEETRLSMLVGVAVGLELGRELGYPNGKFSGEEATDLTDNATDQEV